MSPLTQPSCAGACLAICWTSVTLMRINWRGSVFCSAAAAASWPGLVWRSVGGGLEIPVNNTRHYERMEFCGIMYLIWYFIKRNCQEKLLKISKEEITIFINNLPLAVVCQCWVMRRRHCCWLKPILSWWNFSTLISTLDSPRVVNLLDMINSCFWSRPGPIQPTFLLVPAEPSVCIMSCFLVQVETESRVWHPGFRGTGHWS